MITPCHRLAYYQNERRRIRRERNRLLGLWLKRVRRERRELSESPLTDSEKGV